ncbi:MAG TPA: hypothetical protein VHA56_10830 [Mucilaginibacter sp.]|nr:hypothetical protein [Mucilaginibacter sp.]
MKPYLLFFLLAVCMPRLLFSQSNYLAGKVVTSKGDTLKGYIDYRDWNNNPDVISFKSSLSDAGTQKFTTSDIVFFSVDNVEAFQKYSGRISMDGINISHLNTGKDTSFKMAEVFLRILQKGNNVALYSYTDNLKTRYFISDSPDFTPSELVYRIYEANDASGLARTHTDQTYLRQLNSLAIKYGVLDDALERTLARSDYQKPALMLIAGKINKLSEQEYRKNYDKQSAKYFYAGAGVNLATTKPSPNSTYEGAGGTSYTSALPLLKAGINMFALAHSEKIEFRFEVSLSEWKYTSTYDNAYSPRVNITYAYSNLALSLSPQMIFNFYDSKTLKIFAGGGLEISKYIYFNKKYRNNADGSTVPTDANPFAQSSFGLPVIAIAGLQLNNKIGIYASHTFAGPVSDDYVFRLNSSSTQFGINYLFR